jgi:hypothetical protein
MTPRRSIEGIDAPWLTEVLNASGHDGTVAEVRTSTIGEGVGMMSELTRLDLTYRHGSGPSSLIAKSPVTNEANLALAQAFNLYRREVFFYRDLAQRTTARLPKIYFADIDDDGADFLILMEDLAHMRLGDQVQGCGLEEARACVEWLGRHHASFWDRTDDPALAFMPPVWPSYHGEGLVQGFAYGWEPMLEAFGDRIPERYVHMKDLYLSAQPALFQWMSTPPTTLVHGDFRMDNLFFDDSSPTDALLALDWQAALLGRGSQDLVLFLTGSVRSEVRRAHERELVARWHACLCEAGVTGYSADDAWDDYRRAVAYTWTIVVVVCGTVDRTNERANAWVSVMLERTLEAMDDLDIGTLVAEIAAGAA